MSHPDIDEIGSATEAIEEAERVVREVSMRWDHRQEDLGRLLDGACAKLADRANHELRQILTQVSTDLELLGRALPEDRKAHERIDRMLEAIGRATRLAESHLDRDAIAQLLITIDREPIDLADLISAQLPLALSGDHDAKIDVEPAKVLGDREKLSSSLGYLLETAHRQAGPGQRLHVQLNSGPEGVEGLIGLEPGNGSARALVEELDKPLDIEEALLDLAYVRAVVERHGGTLFAKRFGEDGLGLGFVLPRPDEEVVG